jgi:hypothetical protein
MWVQYPIQCIPCSLLPNQASGAVHVEALFLVFMPLLLTLQLHHLQTVAINVINRACMSWLIWVTV